MQLLFYLVYYHSTCFGHGLCPLHLQIPLGIGLLHPTRIDTHWWLPLQFCVLLLKINQVKQKLHLVGYLPIQHMALC